ncbi:CLUMA_CG002619, isoform A [Clunio marinus]|uniref:CLUMA_CG002619, isoform A n=1 Tax=Clunio marinus TaxID=568069 RepID=A0A1J1HL76_9DIPT|nr:CLUMA_CG002619, isoform A [Clunio marinus]
MENPFEFSLLLNIFVALSFISFVTFLIWIFRRQDYFKNHNIPYINSFPLLGSYTDSLFGRTSFYYNVLGICNRAEVKEKLFFGIFLFHNPCLMIKEPEIIKRILVKDFQSFNNRYTNSDVHDVLGYYELFILKNPLWKKMRGKLSPFFTSGRLKSMFYILDKISNDLVDFIHKRLDDDEKVELEIKHLTALYSTDVIASCVYGIDAKSLENPKGEFREIGRLMFEPTFWRILEYTSVFLLPQITKLFGFKAFTEKGDKFIRETVTQAMIEREKNIDILMAQAAVFFLAGYETSSTTNAFAMYEIAKSKEIQDRLRNEIREVLVKNDGKVTYDSIMNATEIPYLNQIINETLRLYPILPILDRVCTKSDGYSLEPFSDFKIPCGMPIHIPVYAIHLDEKNFPEPLKFDPERFSQDNIQNIKPFTFFPFGHGPRNCIGERFGLMQVKTAIVKVLKDFRLEPSPRTPMEIVIEKKAFLIQSDKELLVDLIKDPLY